MNLGRIILLAALLAAGCSRQKNAVEESGLLGPQYSARNGLLLPTETQRAIGLKLTDVDEQPATSTLEFHARIFERAGAVCKASARVAPEQARLVRRGLKAEAWSAAGEPLAAEVAGTADQLAKVAGQMEVLIDLPDAPKGLALGEVVRVRLTLGTRLSVVTIPRAALLQCTEGDFVYTVSGEHLVRTAVKVGASTEQTVEITDGLLSGDQVVERPVMSLWLTELAAVKGGQACCIEPPKGK